MIEAMKYMYQLLLTEPHAPTLCERLERIAREAIKEWESQEPVAWISPKGHIHFDPYLDSVPLYTHPPQRTWVGLTNEEVELYWDWEDFQCGCGPSTLFAMVRDIEARLKDRNT